MTFRALLLAACLALPFTPAAVADGFKPGTSPSFADIEPRLVYGQVRYDVKFSGQGGDSAGDAARKFLDDVIKKKFSNESGNYIVTLELSIGDKVVVSEPIMSASWDKKKFLFITTSTSKKIVIDNDGVLLDGIVVDNVSNLVGLSMKVLFSKSSSVDMSLFKQVSDLSESASMAAFAPGVAAVSAAIQPFTKIFEQLLSSYKHEEIVENTVGAFTLLDSGFPNQLSFTDKRMTVNIYLGTENSQLPGSFDTASQKFKPSLLAESVLATVESGAGAARATVFDIILQDSDAANEDLRAFLAAVLRGQPMAGGFASQVRPQCLALKSRLAKMVTTRDASLVYWAFLKVHGAELRKYADGKACGDTALTESLLHWGLDAGAEWAQL